MPRRTLIEIAAASVADCLAAATGGADRIELNSALALGGLTPTLGQLHEIKAVCRLPIVAMIRPRGGGFCYSFADQAVMERDLELLRESGADGFALGALTAAGHVDETVCRRLIARAGSRPVVFHRAFDATPDAKTAIEQLIDLGFTRLMTSGRQPLALAGADMIARIVEQAAGRIEVLPCGGINAATAAELLTRTGCDQVHASARTVCDDGSTASQPGFSLGDRPTPRVDQFEATDISAVAALRDALGKTKIPVTQVLLSPPGQAGSP